MISFTKKVSIAAAIFLIAVSVQAKTFMWQVTKGEESFYLGGTIHVLGESDFPLPEAFFDAYKKSHILILEIDFEETQTPEFQTQSLNQMFYPKGETILQKLNKKTQKKLQAYALANGINLQQVQSMRAGFLSIMITLNELARLDMLQDGVDQIYFDLASRDRKPVVGLETAREQLLMLGNLGKGYESEVIEQTLADAKELPMLMHGMKKAWREGDVKTLEKLVLKPMRKKFPRVYENLLVKRNQRWLPELLNILDPELNEIVLVGAGHLLGRDGLLEMLKTQGFTLTQL